MIDTRAGEGFISTHNYLVDPVNYAHEKIKATYKTNLLMPLLSTEEFLEDIAELKTVYIDEGQFFADLNDFVFYVGEVANIHVATLDKDWKRDYFPAIKKCQNESIEWVQLYAECDKCNSKNAVYSYKKTEIAIDGFLVGGSETYGAICENCDKNE